VLRHHPTRKLFEVIHRDGFGGVVDLSIPGDQVAEVLRMHVRHGAGVTGEEQHHAVLTADLPRKIVVQDRVEAARAGLFVIEFDHLIKPHLLQGLGDRFGIRHGALEFRRHEVVLNPDHDTPGLIVQALRSTDLARGWADEGKHRHGCVQ
jgi:hypothetical protein